MVGWLIVGGAIGVGAAVVRWSVKGGGVSAYPEVDREAIGRKTFRVRFPGNWH